MDGYVPFDRGLIDSTLWTNGDAETIRIWVYLMFVKDVTTGLVTVPIPTIAERNKLSIERVEEILSDLSRPDPYSRSTEFEGRRIKRTEDGIVILNHEKYKVRSYSSTERARRFYERNPELSHRRRGNTGQHGATQGNDRQQKAATKTKTKTNLTTLSSSDDGSGPKDQDGVRVGVEVKRKLKPEEIALWKFWLRVHKKRLDTTVDNKRLKAIRRALDNHTIEEMKKAVIGCRNSPSHMGQNERNTVYNDIELICRDETKFSQFARLYKPGDEREYDEDFRTSTDANG